MNSNGIYVNPKDNSCSIIFAGSSAQLSDSIFKFPKDTACQKTLQKILTSKNVNKLSKILDTTELAVESF